MANEKIVFDPTKEKEVKKSIVRAEGKAHQEETKKADKAARKPKEFEFPAKGKINKYGFLHFSKDLMETLGWEKGVDIPVRINRTEKGVSIEKV